MLQKEEVMVMWKKIGEGREEGEQIARGGAHVRIASEWVAAQIRTSSQRGGETVKARYKSDLAIPPETPEFDHIVYVHLQRSWLYRCMEAWPWILWASSRSWLHCFRLKSCPHIFVSNTYTTLTLYHFHGLKLLMVSAWITSNRDRAIGNPLLLRSWDIGGS